MFLKRHQKNVWTDIVYLYSNQVPYFYESSKYLVAVI